MTDKKKIEITVRLPLAMRIEQAAKAAGVKGVSPRISSFGSDTRALGKSRDSDSLQADAPPFFHHALVHR